MILSKTFNWLLSCHILDVVSDSLINARSLSKTPLSLILLCYHSRALRAVVYLVVVDMCCGCCYALWLLLCIVAVAVHFGCCCALWLLLCIVAVLMYCDYCHVLCVSLSIVAVAMYCGCSYVLCLVPCYYIYDANSYI